MSGRFASPAVLLRYSTSRRSACGFACLVPCSGNRLRAFTFAVSQAVRPSLRSGLCLAPRLREPPAASPFACFGATCGVSLRPSEPFGLLGDAFCHSRTRLHGHRLRRESGPLGVALYVIPAKAGIQGIRFAFLCHSRNTALPSIFTVAERCHSDGVLPALARQNDSLSRTGGREGIFLRIGQIGTQNSAPDEASVLGFLSRSLWELLRNANIE